MKVSLGRHRSRGRLFLHAPLALRTVRPVNFFALSTPAN